MPAAPIDICNLALSHCGNGVEIQALTDPSAEAMTCLRFYQPTLDEILRDFPWPFATVMGVPLALVQTFTYVAGQPRPEWKYSYRFPTDCALFGGIVGNVPGRFADWSVPYKIGTDVTGRLIYTNQCDATANYAQSTPGSAALDGVLVMAFSFLLASYIAPRVSGGDPFKLGIRAKQLYDEKIAKARDQALNEEVDQPPAESSFITERDGPGGWPYGAPMWWP